MTCLENIKGKAPLQGPGGKLTLAGAVDLHGSHLSTVQITPLLQAILAEKQLKMESLSLGNNNLQRVDGQLLASALVRIKRVSLRASCGQMYWLSTSQLREGSVIT